MIAATGVSSASAAAAPSSAKLVTSNQAALLDSHSAIVTAKAPAGSKLGVRLYADGHIVSKTRKLVVHRNASSVRAALTLTGSGIERLRDCATSKLEVRMAVHRGKHTTMVRNVRA